jgi:hypothetical protein
VFAQAAQPQEGSTKFFRVEAGYSSNHGGTDTGLGGALRFGIIGTSVGRLEAGLIAGIPYAGLDAGIEVRLPRRAPVGILLRWGGGLLVEDGFFGVYGRAGGGVEVDVSPRVAVRGMWQAGYHGGSGGPHLMYFGVDYRW